jgi:hypothetical protein
MRKGVCLGLKRNKCNHKPERTLFERPPNSVQTFAPVQYIQANNQHYVQNHYLISPSIFRVPATIEINNVFYTHQPYPNGHTNVQQSVPKYDDIVQLDPSHTV